MAQKLSEEAKKNKNAYIMEYTKQNYKKLFFQLKKDEAEELEKILKKKGWNKSEFLREAIEKLK